MNLNIVQSLNALFTFIIVATFISTFKALKLYEIVKTLNSNQAFLRT